jgi:hypothetical protein
VKPRGRWSNRKDKQAVSQVRAPTNHAQNMFECIVHVRQGAGLTASYIMLPAHYGILLVCRWCSRAAPLTLRAAALSSRVSSPLVSAAAA